jgi:hypothetical protein
LTAFKIPAGVLAQHVIALGKTKSGKSSTLRVLVEGLLDADKPVCIIDPKGDWWGIKSSSDGKKAGYPLVIFGGEHADVPINAHAGASVAELIATGNRSCLIDLGGWMVGERTRFFVDLASSLFKHARGMRHLVIDECHNFAPQGKILDPDAGKMLHWANRLASEGQGKGITILAASQRPQKVHKDFLTSCETLIAKKVIHKLDRDAIKDWIDGCADPAMGKEVIASLAQLKKPQAWVWSPEVDYGPILIEFPMFKTYDSFKPQGADARKLQGWADVDLEQVKSKLEKVVAEAQANDPAALKKRIAELERTMSKLSTSVPVDPDALDRATKIGYEAGHADGMNGARNAWNALVATLRHRYELCKDQIFDGAETELKMESAPQRMSPQRPTIRPALGKPAAPIKRSAPSSGNGDASAEVGAGGKRRILAALAQYPDGMNQRKLSILVDIAPKGGTWRTYMAELRGKGWVDGGKDHMRITDAGLEALGHYEPLPTGDELVQYWRNRLGDSGKRAIFNAVVEAYPGSIDVDEVSRITGIARAGGTWRTYMAELRGLGIIEGRGDLQASADLFS